MWARFDVDTDCRLGMSSSKKTARSDIIVFDLLKEFRLDDEIQSAAIVDDDFW
jgi:hypothetical protein